MNWNAYIDSYCERLIPGFWDEPLNALSNVAFWLAAWWVWHRAQHRNLYQNQPIAVIKPTQSAIDLGVNQRSWDIQALLIMLLLIGAGSFAFHTFATRWAAALDVLFIAVYLHFYLAVYAHRVLAIRWPHAAWGILVFLLLSQAAGWLWSQAAAGLGVRVGAGSGYLGA
jgi:hypothetical protein